MNKLLRRAVVCFDKYAEKNNCQLKKVRFLRFIQAGSFLKSYKILKSILLILFDYSSLVDLLKANLKKHLNSFRSEFRLFTRKNGFHFIHWEKFATKFKWSPVKTYGKHKKANIFTDAP